MSEPREQTAQQRHRERMREFRKELNRRRAYGLEQRRKFKLGLTPDGPASPDQQTDASA
jgi:hypothetical protein